jgi:hypothetical protein
VQQVLNFADRAIFMQRCIFPRLIAIASTNAVEVVDANF